MSHDCELVVNSEQNISLEDQNNVTENSEAISSIPCSGIVTSSTIVTQ
jgi:hypothetical protein